MYCPWKGVISECVGIGIFADSGVDADAAVVAAAVAAAIAGSGS